MDKRHQVFVSSTYDDLLEERIIVMQTLMRMNCIPAGMELFPAADEEQFEFIKKVIDDCDYYLLIIGGRYGSLTSEGLSYTEKEYDYAVKKKIKVIALIHGKPAEIPSGKTETSTKLRKKLEAFRNKVAKNRLVNFWTEASQLSGFVALNIAEAIKMYPAVGWVRANQVSNAELLSELNELRKNKERLETEIGNLKSSFDTSIFTPKEETDFKYIHSQLKGLHEGFCEIYIEEHKKQPRTRKEGIFKYSLVKVLAENVLTGKTEFDHQFLDTVGERIEELIESNKYIKDEYEIIYFQAEKTLCGKLAMFGLLNVISVSDDLGMGIKSRNLFVFSEKLYKFVHWLNYCKKIEDEQEPELIEIKDSYKML